jgi:hypothetical protein
MQSKEWDYRNEVGEYIAVPQPPAVVCGSFEVPEWGVFDYTQAATRAGFHVVVTARGTRNAMRVTALTVGAALAQAAERFTDPAYEW